MKGTDRVRKLRAIWLRHEGMFGLARGMDKGEVRS